MHLLKGSIISLDTQQKCYPETDYIGDRLENQYTKEMLKILIERLSKEGYRAIDCTPWDKSFNFVGDSLSYRIKNINKSNSVIHIAIEFEKGKKTALECWVNNYCKAFKFAEKISNEFSKLSNYKAMVKNGESYLTEHSKMPLIIVKYYFNPKESIEQLELNSIIESIIAAIKN